MYRQSRRREQKEEGEDNLGINQTKSGEYLKRRKGTSAMSALPLEDPSLGRRQARE